MPDQHDERHSRHPPSPSFASLALHSNRSGMGDHAVLQTSEYGNLITFKTIDGLKIPSAPCQGEAKSNGSEPLQTNRHRPHISATAIQYGHPVVPLSQSAFGRKIRVHKTQPLQRRRRSIETTRLNSGFQRTRIREKGRCVGKRR